MCMALDAQATVLMGPDAMDFCLNHSQAQRPLHCLSLFDGCRSEHPELLSWQTLDANDVQVNTARAPQNFLRINTTYVQAASGTGDIEMSSVIFLCATSLLAINDNRYSAVLPFLHTIPSGKDPSSRSPRVQWHP